MSKYSMKDVSRLQSERGWPRTKAMEYYIKIGGKTGQGVSASLQSNYNKALKEIK